MQTLFDAAFNNVTKSNHWDFMVDLAKANLIGRTDFPDVLSWLPRAPIDVRKMLLDHIAEYFRSSPPVSDKDRALMERFPSIISTLRD